MTYSPSSKLDTTLSMMMRGVSKQGTTTLTVSTTEIVKRPEERAEFLSSIKA